jgi:hypothetical protein
MNQGASNVLIIPTDLVNYLVKWKGTINLKSFSLDLQQKENLYLFNVSNETDSYAEFLLLQYSIIVLSNRTMQELETTKKQQPTAVVDTQLKDDFEPGRFWRQSLDTHAIPSSIRHRCLGDGLLQYNGTL